MFGFVWIMCVIFFLECVEVWYCKVEVFGSVDVVDVVEMLDLVYFVMIFVEVVGNVEFVGNCVEDVEI